MITTSITQSNLQTALRAFLLNTIGSGWQVIESQDNRVAMPLGNFVAMTSLNMPMLSTSKATWHDPGTNPGIEHNLTSSQWRCQLDFYGQGAQDAALIVSRLVRTEYACDQFNFGLTLDGSWLFDGSEILNGITVDMQPLYAEDPRNTTMLNAEQQFEERWTFDFIAQFNPIVDTPLDFADTLTPTLVEVEITYP